ncbi:MAG: hypothetical protein WC127_03670 [Acidaminococcaceae bacterium]
MKFINCEEKYGVLIKATIVILRMGTFDNSRPVYIVINSNIKILM